MTTPERDWPSEPTPRDRLLYGIGRVCEVHVLLDWRLAILQAGLTILVNPANPEQAYRPTQGTAARVGRCRDLLRRSGLPQVLRTAADGALQAAQNVNEPRNRVVHDAWFERIKTEGVGPHFGHVQIGRAGLIHHSSDLDFVHDTEQQVSQASDRVAALLEVLAHLPSERASHMPGMPPMYLKMLPAIRGEQPLDELLPGDGN